MKKKYNILGLLLFLFVISCKENTRQPAKNYEIENDYQRDSRIRRERMELISSELKMFPRDWLIQRIGQSQWEDRFIGKITYPNKRVGGKDDYDNIKPPEFYWRLKGVKDYFKESYGSSARFKFLMYHEYILYEYPRFKNGDFNPNDLYNKSGYEKARDNLSIINMY